MEKIEKGEFKLKKYNRQSKILELIDKYEIETQEELAETLKNQGIDVTQATVSRDIRELKLVKVATKRGKYKYASMENSSEGSSDRLIKIFKNSIISVNMAGHILVVKTIPGAAQICASAVDSLGIDEIVGTIAGDDTIFIAVSSQESAEDIVENFSGLLK